MCWSSRGELEHELPLVRYMGAGDSSVRVVPRAGELG